MKKDLGVGFERFEQRGKKSSMTHTGLSGAARAFRLNVDMIKNTYRDDVAQLLCFPCPWCSPNHPARVSAAGSE